MSNPDELLFSGHAIERMFRRGISENEVRLVVLEGETIAEYADDTPYPSRLIFGLVEGRPIHVVVARDKKRVACIVITAYIPQPDQWSPDYRTRRVK
jgi:hypothetical protein